MVFNSGRWSNLEHKKFLQGFGFFGRNWAQVSAMNGLVQPTVHEFEQSISAVNEFKYNTPFQLVPHMHPGTKDH